MGEMYPPTAADYAQAAAQEADDKATNARTEVEALKLQVQELRQFCLMLIMNTPSPRAFSQVGLQVGQTTKDYWWEKLGSYPEVTTANERA